MPGARASRRPGPEVRHGRPAASPPLLKRASCRPGPETHHGRPAAGPPWLNRAGRPRSREARSEIPCKVEQCAAGHHRTPDRHVEPARRDRGRRRPQRPRLRRLARPGRPSRAGVRAPPHRGRSLRGVRVLPRLPRLHHQFPGVAGAQGGGGPGTRAPRTDLHPPGPDADVPVPRRPRVRRVARPRAGRGADPRVLGEGRRRLCRAVRLPRGVRRTPRGLAARAAPDAPGACLPSGDAARRGGVRQGVPRQRRRPARRVPGVPAPEVDARDAGGHVELAEPVLPRLRDVADDAADVARIVERRGRARPPPPGPARLHRAAARRHGKHRAGHAPLDRGGRRGGAHRVRGPPDRGPRRTGVRRGAGGRRGGRGRRRDLQSRPVDDVSRPDRSVVPAAGVPRRDRAPAEARLGVQGGARARRHPRLRRRAEGHGAGLRRDASSGSRRASSTRTGRSRTRSTAARRGVRCSGGCSRPWRTRPSPRPAATS